ncbi:MAG: phospholipase D-like domain-containing protein [Pseudomonadota bacterium]|jgi:cardiolipin synthase A/B
METGVSGVPWGWLLLAGQSLLGLAAAWHALLHKRDSRAALGWMAVALTLPIAGTLLYVLFGINRVRTRAQRRRGPRPDGPRAGRGDPGAEGPDGQVPAPTDLARAGAMVTGLPLRPGNRVELLCNGDQAYPRMLAAIRAARSAVDLATYIFENNALGHEFVAALADARRRGVRVRVLIDGLGEWYSPGIGRRLRRQGVEVLHFNPLRLLPPNLNINLRNHRKLLLVDGRQAFTGGINIGDRHLLDPPRIRNPVADLHFEVRGPVVADLQAVFADTWCQAGGIDQPEVPPAVPEPAGGSHCRVIADGPDEHLDQLALLLQAATGAARRSLRIMTPYFLPSRELIAGLQSAALRGVAVRVLLPGRNNLAYVHWATRHLLPELIQRGVEVRYQPPPFHHGKLVVVDDCYLLLGSANLDPRSLRLNYELGVEVFDPDFAAALGRGFDARFAASAPVSLAALQGASLAVRTRDALCWLASPYL